MVDQRYTKIIKKLQNFIDKKNKLIFVHVDIFRSFKIQFKNKKDFFKTHLSLIENITNSSKLIFPAFNYDFPRKKKFNPKKNISQTDNFTEYYRLNFAKYRTMFQFLAQHSMLRLILMIIRKILIHLEKSHLSSSL